jgi:pSer/pThr/pTyr-binding forkhead associated (FHA) protein
LDWQENENNFYYYKEFSIKIGTHALLEDCSSNGTFIDGEKLGMVGEKL